MTGTPKKPGAKKQQGSNLAQPKQQVQDGGGADNMANFGNIQDGTEEQSEQNFGNIDR